MHIYKNIVDGSKGLLVEVISIIESTSLEYLIVGGWSPFLRNKTNFVHPGTRDVDILFNDGDIRGKIGCAVEALLNNGFLVSAKHEFQLFKELNINGRRVIYHVDLLHPQESNNNPELMVDHFDLGLNENDISNDPKKAKSIALPSSKFLFDGFYSRFNFEHENSEGDMKNVSIPLLDEAGLIFSKCSSAQAKKRPRDSFDIYLALKQPNIQETIGKLKASSSKYPAVKSEIESLLNYIKNPCSDFSYNVAKYVQNSHDCREFCIDKLAEITSA